MLLCIHSSDASGSNRRCIPPCVRKAVFWSNGVSALCAIPPEGVGDGGWYGTVSLWFILPVAPWSRHCGSSLTCTFLKPGWHMPPPFGTLCIAVLPWRRVWISTSQVLPLSRTLSRRTPSPSVVVAVAKLTQRRHTAEGAMDRPRLVRNVQVGVLAVTRSPTRM